MEITYLKHSEGKKPTETTDSNQNPAHIDLKGMFQKLAVHLAILAGYITAKQVKDADSPAPELIDDFQVNGFSIGGKEDDMGVIIMGSRATPQGKRVILNSPFLRFEQPESNPYQFIEHLEEVLEDCKAETMAYLIMEKYGQDVQTQMEFPKAPEEPTEEER